MACASTVSPPAPFPERRHLHHEAGQSIVEILAKAAAAAAVAAAQSAGGKPELQPVAGDGPRRRPFSFLVVLGFLASFVTLLASLLVLIAAAGPLESALMFATPDYDDLREGLLELWNAPLSWHGTSVTLAYLAALTPFLVAGIINLLAFLRLAVGGVRGGPLFLVTCLLLVVQLILGIIGGALVHSRIDEYHSIVDAYVGPSTDSMPNFNWDFDHDPLHRLAWYHRLHRLHATGLDMLDGPEPLIAQAAMPQLSRIERLATLVLVTDLYRGRLQGDEPAPDWAREMVSQLDQGVDSELRTAYLDVLAGYGDPRLEPYYRRVVGPYSNRMELDAASRWLPRHTSLEGRNRFFATLRSLPKNEAILLLNRLRAESWLDNDAWRAMVLDPLTQHPNREVRVHAERLRESTRRDR